MVFQSSAETRCSSDGESLSGMASVPSRWRLRLSFMGPISCRLAALTWPEAGGFRLPACRMKTHIGPLCRPGRARRAAIDSGRCNGVDKAAIELGILFDNPGPPHVLAHALAAMPTLHPRSNPSYP